MKHSGNRATSLTFFWSIFGTLLLYAPVVAAGEISVQPDATLFIQIVNFVLLIVILNIVLYKPIRKVLAQRKEIVEGFENGIRTCFADMENKDRLFTDSVKSARAQGIAEKDGRIEQAEAEEQKIIEELNAKAQVEMEAVKNGVARQIDSIRAALDREVDVFAEAIGEKILGRAV